MAPKIFITGVTGYIGGSVFAAIAKAHPEYQLTVFVRTIPAGFQDNYPKVTVVRGTFEDSELLEKNAAASDIVIHCGDSDHLPAVKSLLQGLATRPVPGYYLHLSGTAFTSDAYDSFEGKFDGIENPRVWSDIDDIKEITSLPDDRFHRIVDRYIQQVGETGKVKTALMTPPDLFGLGTGPALRQSILLAIFVEEIKKKGAAFYLGHGTNRKSYAWIHDLVDVYLLVLDDIVNNDGKKTTWGKEGLYFVASPDCTISQKELAIGVGKSLKARGLIQSAEPVVISQSELVAMTPNLPTMAMYMFGNNARSKADRAKAQLGYVPKSTVAEFWKSLEPEIDAALAKTERSWPTF
ncbi:nucleoside-diphosphate-sugar epimerase [Mycena floridula]|nr:nucleoside-diphosphate-sugar epimerase [Mycena floridula]